MTEIDEDRVLFDFSKAAAVAQDQHALDAAWNEVIRPVYDNLPDGCIRLAHKLYIMRATHLEDH